MTKRNFILLIIVLVIIVASVFVFFYTRSNGPAPANNNDQGTNFLSQFNPFAANNPATTPPATTPPVDISGYQPPAPEEIISLNKISSMPIAGFAVFSKERLIDVPAPTEAPAPVVIYDFGTTTLKAGNTGDAVTQVQNFLNNTLGLGLEVSGVLDTKTVEAVKQWQSDHSLTADGAIGSKTKAAMYSSVGQTTKTTKPAAPPTEFMPALRYVDRATGNIYQTFADKIEERKFSGTIIPKIYEAFFGNKGESVVMRYLKTDNKTIESFVGNLPKELLGSDTTGDNEIKGSFLPEDIKDVSLSSDTISMFYLFNVGDSMVGTTLNLANNKKVQVFDSPFAEWLSVWPNNKTITLTTKPSSLVPGYMYALDLSSKNFTKTLGGINGLTTLMSPSGKLVLYSDSSLALNLYHTDTKTSDSLGIKTLPEKCVWGKASDVVYCGVPKTIASGEYPDSWYQGEVSFSDQIWKVDIQTGNATLITDPSTISGGEDIDATKLAMDDGENYLFFVNRKDSFLWELQLKSK